jgi:uncharacterized membrane protein YdjX (TVP38/TMEM64 family)
MTARAKKSIALASLLLVAAAIALIYGTTADDLAAWMQRALGLCREAGPLVFFGAMAVLPAFGFPLAPFIFAAGPAFGPTLGIPSVIVCAVLAVAINVSLSYWIAARLFRPVTARFVAWMGYRLPVVSGRSAWLAALVVRIVPGPPFFLQSYLLGLARVPFAVYLCVSTLVPFGYITSIVLFGDALARGDGWAAAGAAALLLLVGAAIHFLRRRLAASAPDASEAPGAAP